MQTRSLVSILAVAAALSRPAAAQLSAPVRLAPQPVPIHTADDDHGSSYGTWAAGETYKASFHDGMTFVPYLGSQYPHNQPWSWRTTSVRVGEAELLPAAEPSEWHDELRYEYRFGAVTEAYDVRTDGLEQTFVVARRPRATGDLVVTGRIGSLLAAADRSAAHGPLTFRDDAGDEILEYGAAFAVDATGDKIPIATAFQDGEIRLRVPASWLAQAEYPVTVDPLLTRHPVIYHNGRTIRTVDIAYDKYAKQALVVSVVSASQFDDDVDARLTDQHYNGIFVIFSDVTSSWDSDGASVAFDGPAARWVIALRRYFGSAAVRRSQLRCHVHDSGQLTWSTSVIGMSPPPGFNDWRPRVGGIGTAFTAASPALIVFQRENNAATGAHWGTTASTDVYGVLFDAAAGGGAFGVPFAIAGGNSDYERPTVNRSAEGGQNFSWVCAFQRYDNSPNGNWDALARRISNQGTASGFWTSAVASTGQHQLAPQIDGRIGRYAMTFAAIDGAAVPANSLVTGNRLYVERFDWPHGQPQPSTTHPPVVLDSDNDRIFAATGIAVDLFTSSHWGIGYRKSSPAPSTAAGVRVGYTGQPTEGPFELYTSAGDYTTGVAATYNDDLHEVMFCYGVNTPTPGDPVYGHSLAYPTPAPWTTSGSACVSMTLLWWGRQLIGSEHESIIASGGGPSAMHFLMVSLVSTDQPLTHPAFPANCRLLVSNNAGWLGTMPVQVGAAGQWGFPLPEWLPPLTLYFQDLVFDGSVLRTSQRLEVPVVK